MIVPLFIFGSLLHFAYNWSKHKKEVAVVAAVNESYWEHVKIAFWPLFLFYLIEFAIGGWRHVSFLPAKTIALYIVLILIVSFVYIYKYFLKHNFLVLDILIFFLGILGAQIIGTILLNEILPSNTTILFSFLFLFIILIAFVVFTFRPPKDPDLFKDPITKKYGLKGHK